MSRRVDVIVAPNTGFDSSYEGFREIIYLPDDLQGYAELWRALEQIRTDEPYPVWKAAMRLWSAGDWYFRLMFVMSAGRDAFNTFRNEPHFWHPVHIELARWCQFGDHEEEFLVASRGLGKSTHLTLNDDIGRKLLDPNHASCTFSHTKEFAQKHMNIKMEELRGNALLKELWDDRFHRVPEEDASLFSLKDGINIKRTTTRLEPSFSAHPFEAKLPTGMHFDKRYYDDIEVDDTVENDERMDKVEARYVSSQDLSSSVRQKAITGTYYHPSGPMRRLELKYGMRPRVWASEDRSVRPPPDQAGPAGGAPANGFTKAELDKIIRDKGGRDSALAMRSYGRQNLCDPLAGEAAKLDPAYLNFYEGDAREIGARCNIYVTVDPSPGLDNPTWAWVWGLAADHTIWWLDGFRKKLTPARRLAEIHFLALQWNAIGHLVQVRIESYGQGGYAEAQEEYFRDHGVDIPVCKVADPKSTKRDREFEAWEPPLRNRLLYFPRKMLRENELGEPIDLVRYFVDHELSLYPQPATDDGLDGGGLLWARERAVGGPLEWPSARVERRYRYLDEDHGPRLGAMGGGIV